MGGWASPVLFLTINPATFMEPENLMFCWKVVLHKNNDVLELHLCALETFSFAESPFVRRIQWNDEWRKGELTRLGNDWLITFIQAIFNSREWHKQECDTIAQENDARGWWMMGKGELTGKWLVGGKLTRWIDNFHTNHFQRITLESETKE